MTHPNYLALKAALVQGGTFERRELLTMMTTRRRAEFACGLVLCSEDRLETETWRMLAIMCAQDVLDMLEQVGETKEIADRIEAQIDAMFKRTKPVEACEVVEA